MLILAALALLAAVPAATAAKHDTSLSVVGYSIPTAVFPKLEAAYGHGVSFSNSFAASEVQSKAVAATLPTGSGNAQLNTTLAAQQATQYFQDPQLGPSYIMTITTLTANDITIRISHDKPVDLIAAIVPIHTVTIVVEAIAVQKLGF